MLIEVKKDSQKVAVVTEFGGKDPLDANLVVVKFSVRQSGQYGIHIMVENSHVKGSPFTKTFLPSAIDPHKTLFLKQTSTVVCVTGQVHKLIVEPRDGYGNLCRVQDFCLDLFRFGAEQVHITIFTSYFYNLGVQVCKYTCENYFIRLMTTWKAKIIKTVPSNSVMIPDIPPQLAL